MGKRSFLSGLIARALFVAVLVIGSSFSFLPVSQASVSSQISYQARLWTTSGGPVPDGNYSIKFSLYTGASGGTPIWTAKGTTGSPIGLSVTVTNGAMSVMLGDVSSGQNALSSVDWTQSTLYLGITIDPDVAEMTPRRLLASVPQAFQANNASQLQGMSASSTASAGQTLFTIHQTDISSAASTRSALDVRSDGTSDTNDYLFRGLNNTASTVFSINRLGVVSSTGSVTSAVGFYAGAGATFYGQNDLISQGAFTVSSTGGLSLKGAGGNSSIGVSSEVTIAGQTGIILNGGSGQVQASSDMGVSLGTESARFNAYLGYVTSTNIATGLVSTTNMLTTGSVTSTIESISSLVQQVGYTSTLTGITGRMQIANNRLYVMRDSSIEIFDITDPKTERYLGAVTLMGSTSSFTVRGGLLYIFYRDLGSYTNRLSVYDVVNPATPTLSGYINMPGMTGVVSDIVVNNQFAYVGLADAAMLYVVDVSDPAAMILGAEVDPSGNPSRLSTDGRYLYMTRSNGGSPGQFMVYDLTDPSVPVLRYTLPVGVMPSEMRQVGSVMYVLNRTDETFTVINIQNPASPWVVTTVSIGAVPSGLALFGSRLVIGTTDGTLNLYDVSSSTAPVAAGSYTVAVSSQVYGLASTGRSLFVASNTSPRIRGYEVPGITVDAFKGGQGLFYTLDVQGNLKIAQNVDIGGSLAVGQGGILSHGGISAITTGTNAFAGTFINESSSTLSDRSWGLYSNRLLVGEDTTATGSKNYVSMFTYDSAKSRFGVCIDNTDTASTCLGFADTSTVYSLLADDAIGANAFDLAERYAISGEASQGDLLIIDPDAPLHMKKSPGVAYDDRVSGVVSTRPGFLLGSGGNASVALVGRVPLNVTVSNGAIVPGDALVSSNQSGVAMKATHPGVIIGRALEGASTDGRIEVFIQPKFDASGWLQADGNITQIVQDTGMAPLAQATASTPAQSSTALSFRGSVWDGSSAAVSEFRLFNNVQAASGSALTVSYGVSSTLFALSQNGSLSLAGDLALAGKLYPSARGGAQHDSYLFVDDSVDGSDYISTNADGFQSQTGYDYAERYQSPDMLQPGDIVVVRRDHRLYVQRSLNTDDLPIGIVSTKPGFITGRTEENSYPIALAGRVPTNVSSINGAIEPGDALAPSTIPGVAVKATKPGPIIGLALEAFAGQNVGKIEVFVNPTWWGGSSVATSVATGPTQSKNGFAEVTVGKTRVHVDLTTFTRYPHLQITPYSQMEQGWWIDEVNARGFDIVLGGVIGHNARFSWTAIETPDDTQIALSSGRTFSLDPISGQIQFPPGVGDQDPPALPHEEATLPTGSTETPADTTTTTESIIPSSTPESSSITESVISQDVATTTESIEISAAQEEITDIVPIQEITSTTMQ